MKLLRNFNVILSILFILAFVVLSKYEDRTIIRSLDFAATVKIQDRIDNSTHLRMAAFVDNTMEGATFFASPEFTSVIVIVVTFFAFKKYRYRALLIPAAFVIVVLIELFGKSIVHHPSPPFSMIKHTTSVFPANYINEQFSYPSGHAARAVFISFSIYALFMIHDSLFRRKALHILVTVGLFLYVCLVSVSRIYLGHHWLSDVVGGVLLGTGLSLLTGSYATPYNRKAMSD